MKEEYDFSNGRRGPVVPPEKDQIRITLHLNQDVLDYFKSQVHKAGGGDYQNLINEALIEHIQQELEGRNMMNQFDWLKKIKSVIQKFADPDYQNRVWLKGKGEEVSSWSETMCQLFDDYDFELFLDQYGKGGGASNEEIYDSLDTLRNALNQYQEPKVEEKILTDPKWKKICLIAEECLPLIEKELLSLQNTYQKIERRMEMDSYEKFLQEEPDLALLDNIPVLSNQRYNDDIDWVLSSPEELDRYEGKWIAVYKKKILAVHKNGKETKRLALEIANKKDDPPYLHFLEESMVIY